MDPAKQPGSVCASRAYIRPGTFVLSRAAMVMVWLAGGLAGSQVTYLTAEPGCSGQSQHIDAWALQRAVVSNCRPVFATECCLTATRSLHGSIYSAAFLWQSVTVVLHCHVLASCRLLLGVVSSVSHTACS